MRGEDLAAVGRIQELVTKAEPSAMWMDNLREEIGGTGSRCLVAVEAGSGEVVGFIISEIKVGVFGAEKSGWLGYIGVSPRLMGQGVGRLLAQKLFEVFAAEGVEKIYTAVRWDSGDMLSFFKSLGFDRSNFINLLKRLP